MGTLRKYISLLAAAAVMFSGAGFAQDGGPGGPQAQEQELVLTEESIGVPDTFGMVTERFTGKDSRLIIHIQDIHCNYEAQSNIANILNGLYKEYGVSFVSVEGADGMVDTVWFKKMFGPEARAETARRFMETGEITGPEYLSFTTDYAITLFGAEVKSLYSKNLDAFTSSYDSREEVRRYLHDIKEALNGLKSRIYSNALKELDSRYAEYKGKRAGLPDYAGFLEKTAARYRIPLGDYPDLEKYIRTLKYGSVIDFEAAKEERVALLSYLSEALPQEELSELALKSYAYQAGKARISECYEYIKSLSARHGIPFKEKYPNLYYYCAYIRVYEKIDNKRLFKEIYDLNERLTAKAVKTEDQRLLSGYSDHADLLTDMFNVELTNDGYNRYKESKGEAGLAEILGFIKAKNGSCSDFRGMEDVPDSVREGLRQMSGFYEAALVRDLALVDNTLKGMEREDESVGVLVAGGFHTEGITKLLKEKGISYIVISPVVTKTSESPYFQVLAKRSTLCERLSETVAPSTGVKD